MKFVGLRIIELAGADVSPAMTTDASWMMAASVGLMTQEDDGKKYSIAEVAMLVIILRARVECPFRVSFIPTSLVI